ncbi:MAG: 3-isopropylmalate dehydrogenase [Acidobacteria bacterium]|nr:3-isopropylmalate dehydrogenase [Acidobacteriota bacterium]
MSSRVVALPGDGIGPEVVEAGLEVLRESAKKYALDIEIEQYAIGGRGIEEYGDPLPPAVLEACRKSRAVLLGSVGDARYDSNPHHLRPERALLQLRKELGLFANLRPIKCHEALTFASPLKPEIVKGVDILIVRELIGGIYFGEPRGLETRSQGRVGFNSEVYYDFEIQRIARVAFEASRSRGRRVTSVDKSNVLESSQLWRSVVSEAANEYADVSLSHILVDNCAMQLIARPRQFDVLLCTNMFGDILSDEAAMLTGSIGMLPSASVGGETALYEPVHGTAPDIAGKGKANPLATIASVALLFRHSFQREDIARRIETAVEMTLNQGVRTADIALPSDQVVGTRGMLDSVLENLSLIR